MDITSSPYILLILQAPHKQLNNFIGSSYMLPIWSSTRVYCHWYYRLHGASVRGGKVSRPERGEAASGDSWLRWGGAGQGPGVLFFLLQGPSRGLLHHCLTTARSRPRQLHHHNASPAQRLAGQCSQWDTFPSVKKSKKIRPHSKQVGLS